LPKNGLSFASDEAAALVGSGWIHPMHLIPVETEVFCKWPLCEFFNKIRQKRK
jgi:hypothetical protein